MNEKVKQIEFMELYDQCHARLSRYVRAMVKDSEEAKDIISESVLLAYEKFETIKSKEAFLSYIFTIASRLNYRRTWKKKLFFFFEDENQHDVFFDEVSSEIMNPETELEIKILYTNLAKLPAKIREAVVLFEISGLSTEEIQKIQGGTISGVKSRLKRGRERLAELMEAVESEEPAINSRFNGIKKNGTVQLNLNHDLELIISSAEHE